MTVIRILVPLATIATVAAVNGGGKGDAKSGEKVFEQCAVCHNATTDEKKVGPSLKGLFERKKLSSGKSVTDENVLAQINSGGNGMPAFGDKLSSKDKDDLLAYLHSL